jgi:hypothetical protein
VRFLTCHRATRTLTAVRSPKSVTRFGYWLFPLLVAMVVLGHACELPAYAGLIEHHADTDDVAGSRHDHPADEALSCDGAVVVPSPGFTELSPVLATAVAMPTASAVPFRATPALDRATISSTGPPLFLLFSSLLI